MKAYKITTKQNTEEYDYFAANYASEALRLWRRHFVNKNTDSIQDVQQLTEIECENTFVFDLQNDLKTKVSIAELLKTVKEPCFIASYFII